MEDKYTVSFTIYNLGDRATATIVHELEDILNRYVTAGYKVDFHVSLMTSKLDRIINDYKKED